MLSKILSRQFLTLRTIKTTQKLSHHLINPSTSHIVLDKANKKLTLTPKYSFSQHPSQSKSQKDPQIFHLRKQIQQTKQKQGEHNQKHIQLLHELTIKLASKNYLPQAIQTATKVVNLNEHQTTKQKNKTLVQQATRILYHRTLQGLYKTVNDHRSNIEVGKKVIEICESLMKENGKVIELMLIEEKVDVGCSCYEVGQIQQAQKMLESAVEIGEKRGSENQETVFKLIKAKNLLGRIYLHHTKQPQQAQTILSSSLSHIHKFYSDKIDMQIVSDCLINLVSIYTNKQAQSLNTQQMKDILSKIDNYTKDICFYYLNNNLNIGELLQFYRNLASLYLGTKDYTKALLCYRFQMEYLKDDDLKHLAQCNENQSIAYREMKKVQKSIEKLVKAFEKRENINIKLTEKRRKTEVEEQQLKQNYKKLTQDALLVSQMYTQLKDASNSQKWKTRHQELVKINI